MTGSGSGMTVRRTSGARQSPFSREGDLGFLTSILSPLTSDPPRERSERLDDALSLHSPTIFCPRSGTGATQSYWHREAILAAAGDWRFFITLHAPLSTILKRTLSWSFSLGGSYRQPTTHNLQRISRVHTPSAGACRHPSARGDLRSKAEERRFEALLGGWTEKNGSGVWSLGSGKNERNETLSRPLFISFSFAP